MKKADAFYHFALYDLDHFLLELVNLFPLAERQIPTVAMASMSLQREIFLYERWVLHFSVRVVKTQRVVFGITTMFGESHKGHHLRYHRQLDKRSGCYHVPPHL